LTSANVIERGEPFFNERGDLVRTVTVEMETAYVGKVRIVKVERVVDASPFELEQQDSE
jgi:hypothetical protein